jgi:hypothetical protein
MEKTTKSITIEYKKYTLLIKAEDFKIEYSDHKATAFCARLKLMKDWVNLSGIKIVLQDCVKSDDPNRILFRASGRNIGIGTSRFSQFYKCIIQICQCTEF